MSYISVRSFPEVPDRLMAIAPYSLAFGTVLAMLLSLCIGVYPVSFSKVAHIMGTLALPGLVTPHPAWSARDQIVVQVIRLPRIIIATLTGLGLGLSGTVLQGMMRNPLVSPDLVGVTSGAAFGGVLGWLFDLPGAGIVALGLAGGLTALTATVLLSRAAARSFSSMTVILAGIFVGAFFTALVGVIEYTSDSHTQLPSMVYWLLGSFTDADTAKVMIIAVPTLCGGAVLMLLRWHINILSLADADARVLSSNAPKMRWLIIATVSLIVASQVAVSGIVGWVGLIVPHLARMMVGPDHRRLLPVAGFLGGLFTLGLDDLSRTLLPHEIPVGLLTAILGTPIVCLLFVRMQMRGWGAG